MTGASFISDLQFYEEFKYICLLGIMDREKTEGHFIFNYTSHCFHFEGARIEKSA